MILIERNVVRMSEVGRDSRFPQLLSNSTVGVQPTTTPTGIYFALRYIYQNNQPNYNPWQSSASYDIASMYPNVIDKSQFKVELPKLIYKREFIWHRSRKKKM
jgi:hypothetical protein